MANAADKTNEIIKVKLFAVLAKTESNQVGQMIYR